MRLRRGQNFALSKHAASFQTTRIESLITASVQVKAESQLLEISNEPDSVVRSSRFLLHDDYEIVVTISRSLRWHAARTFSVCFYTERQRSNIPGMFTVIVKIERGTMPCYNANSPPGEASDCEYPLCIERVEHQ